MSSYDTESIKSCIHTEWAGHPVHFCEETDSTNLWAQRLSDEGAPHGTLCVAEFQSAGRGSRGRSWTAPEGSSVMMSLLLHPEFAADRASMLTLLMGMAVAHTVKEYGLDVRIKWPNDVVVSHKKICGILTEMRLDGDRIKDVVIGLGINVNTPSFPEELSDKATSLRLEAGRDFERAPMPGRVMAHFEELYGRFLPYADLTMLREDYEGFLAGRGEPVRVLDPLGPYEGICRGIDSRGCLLVEPEGEEMRRVIAGEVSVRGLYTYI